MTEAEKQSALDRIAIRIATAEHHGLEHTAKSWRDLYVNVASRPAKDIVSINHGVLIEDGLGRLAT